jgi:phage protein D
LPGSSLRAPAVSVLANGAELAGVVEARVLSGSHCGADRFRVWLALSANDAAFWASATQVLVDVRLGLDGAWARMIRGEVDAVQIDPIRRTLSIEGRDLTARLIQARTQESFQNRTASEIATILAARHDLAAAVTPTTTPAGRYYQLEHDRITLDQFSRATSEWDLLVFLAREEGFDLYVDGDTLHFEAPQPRVAVSVAPEELTDLRLERALTLARDIEVTVKSWNSRQQAAFTETARVARGQGGPQGGMRGRPQQYRVVRPNLTPDQARQLAQGLLTDLSRHERVVGLTMPGELSLTPRSVLALTGTGTEFDQTYFVAEIDRALSLERGFTQRVRACNVSPG